MAEVQLPGDPITGAVPPKPETEPEAPAADRPAWLHEKFQTTQDLQKAYDELEQKQGGAATPAPAAPTAETEPATPAAPEGLAVPKPTVSPAQNVLEAARTEFSAKGQLDAATYTKLEKSGFNKDIVDSYIAGQTALANDFADTIYEVAGGSAEYGRLIDWAETGLSEQERNVFNSAVNTRDTAQATLAVQGLLHRFRGTPEGQQRVEGSPASGPAIQPFQSQAQMVLAMQSPQYKRDPAYREEVRQRLAVSGSHVAGASSSKTR